MYNYNEKQLIFKKWILKKWFEETKLNKSANTLKKMYTIIIFQN